MATFLRSSPAPSPTLISTPQRSITTSRSTQRIHAARQSPTMVRVDASITTPTTSFALFSHRPLRHPYPSFPPSQLPIAQVMNELSTSGTNPSATFTPEPRSFDWARDDYSPVLRTIRIYTFVLQARAGFSLLDAAWSYGPGGSSPDSRSRRATRLGRWLREELLALGPTFIKFGQLFSTRSDLLAAELVAELGLLQDRVPAFPTATAKQIITRELGSPVSVLFQSFDDTPLAAASLGQVHRATTKAGEEVVVKVQRPGLRRLFDLDLANVRNIAIALDKQDSARDFTGILAECEAVLYDEIDYIGEGMRADRFRRNMRSAGRPVTVPRVDWSTTSPQVLTMSYNPGTKITDVSTLRAQGQDLPLLAQRLTETYLDMLLRDGYFHADPHPGNIAVSPDGNLIFYDFGMMGEIKGDVRSNLLRVFRGIYRNEPGPVLDALEELGVITSTGDRYSLLRAIGYFLTNLNNKTERGETLAAIGEDLFTIAIDQPFRFPATFTFVVRAFSTLEGLGKGLDPTYKFNDVAAPYSVELLDLSGGGGGGGRDGFILEQVQKELEERATDVANGPARLAKVERTVDSLEKGDLRLRVRVPESERADRRMGLLIQTTLTTLLAMGSLNTGTTLWASERQGEALLQMLTTSGAYDDETARRLLAAATTTSTGWMSSLGLDHMAPMVCFLVAAISSVAAVLGWRRVQRLERFEKGVKGQGRPTGRDQR